MNVSIAIFGAVVFTLLGLFFGFALAVTSRRFYVPVDPRVDQVRHALPSANCGACGFPGCQAYAEAVVEEGKILPSLCIPGGEETAKIISELTGKTPENVEDQIVVLRCHGRADYVKEQAEYRGVYSCAGASLVFGGPKECKNGCLGLGDCLRACPFDAIRAGEGGIVEILPEKCTGCGLCLPACPKKILELYPRNHRVELSCVAREKTAAVRAKCQVGCTTCQKCVASCPASAVAFDQTTLLIDHAKCFSFGPSCQEACVDICPTFVLHRLKQLPLPEGLARASLPAVPH